MKSFTTTLIAAAAMLIGAHANAAMVETWSVDIAGTWTAAGPSGVTRTASKLTWGTSTGEGRSSLVITNPALGLSLNTYVGTGTPPAANTVQTLTLTHNNNPITGTSLETATLSVSLSLTPTLPAATGFPLGTIDYAIKFFETPNTGACAVVGSLTPCDDIFVLTSGLLNESFEYDGISYFVNAFPTADGMLKTLDDRTCTAAGAGRNCLGFTTGEGKSNKLTLGLSISTLPLSVEPPPSSPVSEPASLALLGLALAGAGFSATRRRQAR